MSILLRLIPDRLLINRYKHHGAVFGDSLSYIYMGECIGFRMRLRRLIRYEAEIIRRGFMPYTLNDFVGYGGYGKPLPEIRKVAPGEQVWAEAEQWEKENPEEVSAIVPWREWFGWSKKKGDKEDES